MKTWIEIFGVALKLGLTSFGGPVAHLAYFHREYVVRRRWLDEAAYADLVALCQALPGPASSQVGMAVGRFRGGVGGAVAAWLGFTLPSALLMVLFASAWMWFHAVLGEWPFRILGLVALMAVTQAIVLMGRKLLTTWVHGAFALAMAMASSLAPLVPSGVFILFAGIVGAVVFKSPQGHLPRTTQTIGAIVSLGLFVALLGGLFAVSHIASAPLLTLADGFYRTGALVFGGGHVVLPLLQNEFVAAGRLDESAFLALYGLAQIVPGPLFTLAAGIGFVSDGPLGAVVALVAVFLPSLLLVLGVLPFWDALKARPWFRNALAGVNASVVGLLAWAWCDPLLLGVWQAWASLFRS